MANKKDWEKYREDFEKWRNDKIAKKDYTVGCYGTDEKIVKLTRRELLSFTQCYAEKDSSVEYARCRSELPQYWFLSEDNCTLITCNKKYRPTPKNKKEKRGRTKHIRYDGQEDYFVILKAMPNSNDKKREHWELRDRKPIDVGAVYCFVFGGEATNLAKERLNELGIEAMSQKYGDSSVDFHHKGGYEKGKTNSEIRKLRVLNAQKGKFELNTEHTLAGNIPALNISKEKRDDKTYKFIKKRDEYGLDGSRLFIEDGTVEDDISIDQLQQAVKEIYCQLSWKNRNIFLLARREIELDRNSHGDDYFNGEKYYKWSDDIIYKAYKKDGNINICLVTDKKEKKRFKQPISEVHFIPGSPSFEEYLSKFQ